MDPLTGHWFRRAANFTDRCFAHKGIADANVAHLAPVRCLSDQDAIHIPKIRREPNNY